MRRRLALVPPDSDRVIEVRETDRDDFGNPGGVWHDVTEHRPEITAGWLYRDGMFLPPPPAPAISAPPAPTLAQLRARLDALGAEIARLEKEQG